MTGTAPATGDPGAILAGAMRCGTTTLARALAGHPDVHLPPEKEVHFFDEHWDRGWDWYRGRFAAAAPDQVRLDATPTYMWWEPAFERMARHLPEARYVVALRDPVERAWSHYWYMRARGRERLGFEAALAAEDDRLRHADLTTARTVSYATRGLYAPQVARLIDAFGREAVHVVGFPRLRHDPERAVAGVVAHLGLRPLPVEARPADRNPAVPWRSPALQRASRRLPAPVRRRVRRWNATADRGHQPSLPDDVRRRLAPRFAADRDALVAVLRTDPLAPVAVGAGAEDGR